MGEGVPSRSVARVGGGGAGRPAPRARRTNLGVRVPTLPAGSRESVPIPVLDALARGAFSGDHRHDDGASPMTLDLGTSPPLHPIDSRLEEHGAEWRPGAARALLDDLRAAAEVLPGDRAGVRVQGFALFRHLLHEDGVVAGAVRDVTGSVMRPVRAVLFDKTAATNWSLAWHQDRTICVRERREVAGLRSGR